MKKFLPVVLACISGLLICSPSEAKYPLPVETEAGTRRQQIVVDDRGEGWSIVRDSPYCRLLKFEPGSLSPAPGIPLDKLYAHLNYLISAGDKLCIVYNDLLQVLDLPTQKIIDYKSKESFDNAVLLMAVRDPQDPEIVWLATAGSGLVQFNLQNGHIKMFTHQNGFPEDTVYHIVPDGKGFLWCSGDKGIFRFNPLNYHLWSFIAQKDLQANATNISAGWSRQAKTLHPSIAQPWWSYVFYTLVLAAIAWVFYRNRTRYSHGRTPDAFVLKQKETAARQPPDNPDRLAALSEERQDDQIINHPFLKKLYDIIGNSVDDATLDVGRLAEKMFISRSTLNRKLSALLNLSAHEVIHQYRLKEAARLLQAGYSISETAYRVGFKSVSYFSTSFKNFYGIVPSEYTSNATR